MTTVTNSKLPVVIAGAGPCGLVAAITLQQQGVPFLVVERASREKLCSNVGSGFDLGPTAIDILMKRLQIPNMEEGFQKYGDAHMCNMEGKKLREFSMLDEFPESPYTAANRAAMQECFLKFLINNERAKSTSTEFDESTVLKCGVQVTGYEENDDKDCVAVKLSDGISIDASALLGCDGIHSSVRRSMMESLKVKDELHFCNIICYWGKTTVEEGSELYEAFEATQKEHKDKGSTFVWALGGHRHPGCFMTAPCDDTLMWAFFVKSFKEPKKKSDDLTRRGGAKLDDEAKDLLEFITEDRSDLIRLIVKETPASSITQVGLYDRKNLHLPYTQGRVALLGDSAHCQSPFMGQGCNQAITDAYVCAMRLSKQSVPDALQAYDSKSRRKAVNAVIKDARSYGNISCSHNRLLGWMFSFAASRLPISFLYKDMLGGDLANEDFVRALDKDLEALNDVAS